RELGRAARAGTIPGGSIENGVLHIEKLEAAAPTGAEDLVLDLGSDAQWNENSR
ncbi:hypothetical protein ONM13_004940, partial [Salmonella enterica]|nr:hypothetical protein [Salmonella enterica]